jgi:uncharacterized protein YcaQ
LIDGACGPIKVSIPMLPTPIRTNAAAARRFLVAAHFPDPPLRTTGDAIAYHGFVQMDPLNVCGRMHDLILRNRVGGYAENGLLDHLHNGAGKRRSSFEQYLPGRGILAAFSVDAWPHLLTGALRRRERPGSYAGKLSKAEEELAARIIAEITARGPLSSDDIEHDARAATAWGTRARMVKTVLEKLFVHGRVLISRREHFRRVYDLPDRVLPADVITAPVPPPDATRRWLVELRLRQHRLAAIRKSELAWVEDIAQPVLIEGVPPLYCLRSDAPLFDAPRANGPGGEGGGGRRGPRQSEPLLLAPLDPMICNRSLTLALWNFDYTWEVYTPAAKRRRGYYALPVLAGHEIIGHVDPKADRVRGRLAVVSRRVPRGHRIGGAVRKLARFLGLK